MFSFFIVKLANKYKTGVYAKSISTSNKDIHARSPAEGKISWYFRQSYGLMMGDADLTIFEKKKTFFLISGTFGSFWDVAPKNKPILREGMI